MASNPLAVFLLLGLNITSLSVGPASLPEIKKVIRAVPAAAARASVHEVLSAATPDEVVATLTRGLSQHLDLSLFSDRWNLSPVV
jgi:signal transduction protein with GAF and PtsI domain